jgi:hypothetical protein
MTLKSRISKLERRTGIQPSYAQAVVRREQEQEALSKKLEAMTAQQVVEFVLVSENIPRQREFALKRLSLSDLATALVKKAILELKQIRLLDYQKREGRSTGPWRELYLRECKSLESAIWELRNEQEAH